MSSPPFSLTRIRGNTHMLIIQGYVHSFVTSTQRECQMPIEMESRTPYLAWMGSGKGKPTMSAVVAGATLFPHREGYQPKASCWM